ncbi:MAG: peptidoglycan-binding protein [Candidatus Omnitrophica bacterium]|nr:peptidoglycan-binding protein [Candidatus Omnitrophota bacterium]
MMKIKLGKIILIIVFVAHVLFPISPVLAAVSLTAPSALLWEPSSDKILYSRAPHRKQAPASTTKIVTAMVILDHLRSDDWVTINPAATQVEASKLYFRSGDKFQVRDLLKAILMKSANDAAKAAAIDIAGSERAFADLLTQKAKSLGAENTRFVNASGLPAKGQYSTAYDLALIMRAAARNDVIVSILRQKKASIKSYYGHWYHFKSHNKMLMRGENVIGKTGWTRSANYCFVGQIEGESREAIVSVLGSKKLWTDLRTLVVAFTGKSRGILSYGDRGEDVRQLQAALRRAGFFKVRPTGYYGKITKRAVVNFQKSHRLSVDGVAGVSTRKTLEPYL